MKHVVVFFIAIGVAVAGGLLMRVNEGLGFTVMMVLLLVIVIPLANNLRGRR